ncbi:MAG: RHS repeat-associated core domain-containing protein, partial [Acidobacteriota bacterium]
YVWDQVGSVRVVANAAGVIVETHDYEPYGQEIGSPPCPSASLIHYAGQERDYPTSDCSNTVDSMHFRSYGALIGRFYKPDNVMGNPYGPQSWNLYAYVGNNPIGRSDPTGHLSDGVGGNGSPPYKYPAGQFSGDAFIGGFFAAIGTFDAVAGIIAAEGITDSLLDNQGRAGSIEASPEFMGQLRSNPDFHEGFLAWLSTDVGEMQWAAMRRDADTAYHFTVGQIPTPVAPSQTLPNATADPFLDRNAPTVNYRSVTIVIDMAHVEENSFPSERAGVYAKCFGREAIYATAIGGGRSYLGLAAIQAAFEAPNAGAWVDSVRAEARYHQELAEVANVMGFSIPQ